MEDLKRTKCDPNMLQIRSISHILSLTILIIAILIPMVHGTENERDPLSLVFMGDIVIDGVMEERVNSQGPEYPFEMILPHLGDDEIRFANLEAPISDRGNAEEDKYATFRTEPGGERALTKAGIDVVSLSNNHCLDYGPDALYDTIDILDSNNIAHAGIWHGDDIDNSSPSRPLVLNKNGIKIGFLAYTEKVRSHWLANESYPGPLPLDMDLMREDISFTKEQVDILIVSIHWRKWPQYTQGPEEIDRVICRELIDLGVSIIMGHGPHTIHEIEQYNNGLILYSLGNVAMNAGNKSSYSSYVAKVKMDGEIIQELELIPIRRETYRYVPMGTPILKDAFAGFNVTYEEIWNMFEVDSYNVIDEEDGLNEISILIQDSPWYLKLLLSFALVLLVLLFILIIISIRSKVS